ncbi:hypothetical protein JSE7799_03484 [Jannaschia seosinensis]|uniref:Flp pilus assembly protein TadG n=1 Tax=Jannaschia seosinensis TaxID=313367 RepID=A0A0M7BEY5_9RHOB|nr:TadE family protein [Jannaschia seosinensis]CUH40749.1 hypothetical protein JSE7799_03484 [Jannaschia seosinensis]
MKSSACSPRVVPASRFLSNEDGSMSIEAVLVLPLLCFLFMAGFSYFDGYRRDATMSKATYAVADLLSRRRDVVRPFDLEGLENIYETMVFSTEEETYMRFTEIERVPDADGGLQITWSYATDGQKAMSDRALDLLKGRIPRFDIGKRVLLVQAYTIDQPDFRVFLPDRIVDTIHLVSARYERCIAFSPTGDDPDGCVLAGGSGSGSGTTDEPLSGIDS